MQDLEPFLVGGEWRTGPAVLDVTDPYNGNTVGGSVCLAGGEKTAMTPLLQQKPVL